MTAVNQLCTRAIHLESGRMTADGAVSDVISGYLRSTSDPSGERVWPDVRSAPGGSRARLHAVRVKAGGVTTARIDIDREVELEVEFWILESGQRQLCPQIDLLDGIGNTVLSTVPLPKASVMSDAWFDRPHPEGLYRASCTLPADFLNDGRYYLTVYLVTFAPSLVEAHAPEVLGFEVFDTGSMRDAGITGKWHGAVRVRLPWKAKLMSGGAKER
jgi:lipopolysaccharide transport system ATP-binding protein